MEQIAKALNEFQSNLPEVKLDATVKVKTKSGSSYNFKYATLANIIKTVLPGLVKNGLSFSQTFDNGTLGTTLYHVSGEKIESHIPLNMGNASMQEIGSRISYLKRYSLSAMLGIVAEEDDDANIADGNAYQKADKKKPSGKSKEMSTKQMEYIISIGEKEHQMTREEIGAMVTWKADQQNLSPRHWKMSKLLLPEKNFEQVLSEYSEHMMNNPEETGEDGF